MRSAPLGSARTCSPTGLAPRPGSTPRPSGLLASTNAAHAWPLAHHIALAVLTAGAAAASTSKPGDGGRLPVMRFADAAAAEGRDSDPLPLDPVARVAPHFAKVVVYDGM